MIRSNSIAAVIAAYNARERIAEVITRALRHVQTVIVADDGSTDGTAQVEHGVPAAAVAGLRAIGAEAGVVAALDLDEGRVRGQLVG